MISSVTNRQINIALQNTNKALAEVLKDITPQELEVISKGKDLKSIMHAMLKGGIGDAKSDKVLLELLKNNPTLKKIGTVSNSIENLLKSMKSDKNPLPIARELKNFLVNIKDLDESVLKKQITNSGVFYESKLKEVKNPQIQLKNVLETLLKTLKNSRAPEAKGLERKVLALLSQPTLKTASAQALLQPALENSKNLQEIAKEVKNLSVSLQEVLGKEKQEKQKSVSTLMTQLEELLKPKMPQDKKAQKTLGFEQIKTFLQHKPDMPEGTKLQEMIKDITHVLSQKSELGTKGVEDKLTTLLQVLQKHKSTTPPITNREVKSVETEIKSTLEILKKTAPKVDNLFSHETKSMTEKLSHFTSKESLLVHSALKEIEKEDLKSVLTRASEEILHSSHPKKVEIMRHIDRLMMQIDYNQIVSHLSNSTSLYLPFSWDEMRDGSMQIHPSKEDRFYCDIDLNLKEYGGIKVRIILYEKNQINIYLNTEHEALSDTLNEQRKELYTALQEVGINPREIKIMEKEEKEESRGYKSMQYSKLDMGFDIKI